MADLLLARTDGLEGFERHVVIKRIRPELAHDRRFIRMFIDEARVAATLHHQNIVQVHDVGEVDGEYFIAMEYVHGEDTRQLLENAARMRSHIPLGYALSIISAAAAGLHHAHERLGSDRQPLHIVHRDVSPSNILIGYDGSVKLLDFGIATATLLPESRSGGVKGKLAYMSPEQVQGGAVDRRSDIYALGVVLYELVTTTPMIKSDSEPAVMDQIVRGRIAPPQSRRPELPSELSAIIHKAIAPDRERRYATADELRIALDQFAWNTGLTAPASSLAAYLRQQFGERPEPWLELEDRGADAMEFEDIAVSTVESGPVEAPAAEPPEPEPADDWAEQPRTTDERPHTSGLLMRSDVGATTAPAQRPPLPVVQSPAARSRVRLAAMLAAGAAAAAAIWFAASLHARSPQAPPAPPPVVAVAAPPPVAPPPLPAAAAVPPDAADPPEDAMALADSSPGRRGHTAATRPRTDRPERPARVAQAAARSADPTPSTSRIDRGAAVSDAIAARAEEPAPQPPAPAPVAVPLPTPSSPPPDAAPAPVRPPASVATAPAAPQIVAPAVLEANRAGGDKTIVPDAVTQEAISRAGVESVVSTYKLCVSAAGEISLVTQMRSSGFPAYDDKIRSTIRATWRYRPYLVDGRATPVCTALRFVYAQRQ